MVSIVVCSNPAESHVAPMLALTRTFVGRGWRVRFVTGGRFAAAVRAAGADPFAWPPQADIMDDLDLSDRRRGLRALNEGLERAFIEPAPHQLATVADLLAAEPADAVVGETSVVGLTLMHRLPEATRPVVVLCGIFPLMLSSRDTAPYGLGVPPMPGRLGAIRNSALYALGRRVLLAPIHRQLDRFMREQGLGGLGDHYFVDGLFARATIDLFAQLTVPSFEYPRPDLPATVRFFGPVRRPPSSLVELPEWWDELDQGRPVVHVSQGTVSNTDFSELVAPTLAALAGEEVLVVVSTGAADRRTVGRLPPLPDNARAAAFLPYDRLMPKLTAFVTNGGYGGLHDALAHGVPIVVAGDAEDKVETSARVAWSGAGISLRTGRPRSAAVARAVRAVLADPRYRAASARIAADIAASPGADGVADAIENLVIRRVG